MPFVPAKSPPSKWLYNSCYLILSAVAFYYMRKSPPSQITAKFIKPLVKSSSAFTYPGHPTVTVRRQYTGIQGLDTFLSIVVTFFLPGPAKFAPHIQLQQANFLFNLTPLVVLLSMESVRARKWTPIIFTSVWAVLYQVLGGAVIIPFYFMAHGRAFKKPDDARMIPSSWAKTLLPAVIFGFLLPTALMYFPFANVDHTMIAIAFWQPSPIYLNAIWVVLKQFVSSSGDPANHIRHSLVFTGAIAAAFHFATLYACFSDVYPFITLSSIFLPLERAATTFQEATHHFFQIDYLIIVIAATLWLLQNRAEDRAVAGKKGSLVADLALLAGSVALLGPGATLCWVWYRRQGRTGLKSE